MFSYLKDTNVKTNIKPPDLWIHHDQMELKALEKTLGNGEASTSAVTSNTLPRSSNSEYQQDNVHGNSSSLDKRTYIPSYMGTYAETTRTSEAIAITEKYCRCGYNLLAFIGNLGF